VARPVGARSTLRGRRDVAGALGAKPVAREEWWALQHDFGGSCCIRGGCLVAAAGEGRDPLGGEAGSRQECEQFGQDGSRVGDADAKGGVAGVHAHQREAGAGGEVIADAGADGAWRKRADRFPEPAGGRGRLDDHVVPGPNGRRSGGTAGRPVSGRGAESFRDGAPAGSRHWSPTRPADRPRDQPATRSSGA
jgi:hypothetical protein